MKVVTVEQMHALERRSAAHGVTVDALMERAGLEVARAAAELLTQVRGARVVVLVGPGNNGGDGLVAARHLHQMGARVAIYLATAKPGAPEKYQQCQERGIPVVEGEKDQGLHTLQRHLQGSQLVIDAVLGTGQARPLSGLLKDIFQQVNQAKAQGSPFLLLALDLPTGLNADTGETDPACPYADATVTLGAPKVGLLAFPGADHVGRLEIAEIGIPPGLDEEIDLELLDQKLVSSLLPRRPLGGHKGSFGRVLVVAGSRNYVGAPYLACAGAYRAGAGLVTLATPESVYRLVAGRLTEATYLPLAETENGAIHPSAAEGVRTAVQDYEVLLVGCGLGQGDATREFLQGLLLSEPPLTLPVVLDADGLNSLAGCYRWWEQIKAPAVLTPHPGEMARLTGMQTEAIQKDRVRVCRSAASQWGQTVVLKGAFTVIAAPKGGARLSPFANPALATAGTGDVLAGVIAGLIAQGLFPYDGASCGVYIHATAAEKRRPRWGESGLMAGDLLESIPEVVAQLRQGQKR